MTSRLSTMAFALLFTTVLQAQDRNTTLGILNSYADFTNASVAGINNTIPILERYNDLLNDYVRKGWLLGGEAPEDSKHPFLDGDVFDIGKNDPAALYKKCLKSAKTLPAATRNDLNAHLTPMYESLGDIQNCLDSLNNQWALSPRKVFADENGPYRFLTQAVSHIQRFHTHRNALLETLQSMNSQIKSAGKTPGYLLSVTEISKGMVICEQIMRDMYDADSSKLSSYIASLNEIATNLENAKEKHLKGIKRLDNINGFDLHTIYDNIVSYYRTFATKTNRFLTVKQYEYAYRYTKTEAYYHELSGFFSFNGLADEYSKYVILIGGGKFPVLTARGYRMIGWGYPDASLPVYSQLQWMRETPLFKIVYHKR